eukprot:scaffold12959_cov58-Phaeocystis_antarctica.AAC.5
MSRLPPPPRRRHRRRRRRRRCTTRASWAVRTCAGLGSGLGFGLGRSASPGKRRGRLASACSRPRTRRASPAARRPAWPWPRRSPPRAAAAWVVGAAAGGLGTCRPARCGSIGSASSASPPAAGRQAGSVAGRRMGRYPWGCWRWLSVQRSGRALKPATLAVACRRQLRGRP